MTTCIYCRLPGELTAEHVIAKKLQQLLGLKHAPIINFNHKPVRPDGQPSVFLTERTRTQTASRLVAGRVCKRCNNEWMSRLEDEARPLLLPLIDGSRRLATLDHSERLLLARWAAKTAYAWNYAVGDFGLIPADHPSYTKPPAGPLPSGVAVFGWQHRPSQPLSHSFSSDFRFTAMGFQTNPDRERIQRLVGECYKASFQISNLHLMTAHCAVAGWRLSPMIGFNDLIYPPSADISPWSEGRFPSLAELASNHPHLPEATEHFYFSAGLRLTDAPSRWLASHSLLAR